MKTSLSRPPADPDLAADATEAIGPLGWLAELAAFAIATALGCLLVGDMLSRLG